MRTEPGGAGYGNVFNRNAERLPGVITSANGLALAYAKRVPDPL